MEAILTHGNAMPDLPQPGYLVLGALAVLALVLLVLAIRQRRRAAPAAPIALEPAPFLERAGDGDGPRLFTLNKPVIIVGRADDSDVRVPANWPGGSSVSRRHAQIRREDADFIVEDLGSQNGIRVNGLATHRNLLRDGYRVSFGSVEFVFHSAGPSQADRDDA